MLCVLSVAGLRSVSPAQQCDPTLFAEMRWRQIGPFRGGRTVAAVGVPGHPTVLYIGVNNGGVWRSRDYGRTWTPIFDDQPTGSIGAIAVAPSDPRTIYVGSGEGLQRPDLSVGDGVFKSTDGGATWRHVGLADGLQIPAIVVDPRDPNRVFVAVLGQPYGPSVERGVYRSLDGGATWQKVLEKDENTGAVDLAFDPTNSQTVFAVLWAARQAPWEIGSSWTLSASNGLYRSTDGGTTWRQIGTGLPGAAEGLGRIGLATSQSAPTRMYAVVGATKGGGLYRSHDGAVVTVNGGETWSSWYNQPTAQFYHVATDRRFPYWVYGGQQESGSVGIVSRGDDGQITFREWHPVGAEEYGYIAPDPLHSTIVYGGRVTRFDWSTGQGQDVSPEPVRAGRYRWVRTMPLLFSPLDPHVLYFGANVLFQTSDGGHSWRTISPDLTRATYAVPENLGAFASLDPEKGKHRGVIYTVAPSPRKAGLLWVGTDDGLIHVTHNEGRTWTDATPAALTPWSKVSLLEASRFDTLVAYAAVNRFRLAALRPHVYHTGDGGRSWTEIVLGLPAHAVVDAVREDPARRGLLYAGTERGVYVSFDDGGHWQTVRLNLPPTSVRDLVVHDSDLVVGTHGRGFWILDDITPLRQAAEAAAAPDAYLYRPAGAVRVRWNENTDTPLPIDEPVGKNPPDGAMIDYYLPRGGGPIALEILDRSGTVVRRFSSADTVPPRDSGLNIPDWWVRPSPILGSGAGMHRFVWDLHYAPPAALRHEYPIAALYHDTPREPRGPWVLPGRYTVRLTVDGRTFTRGLSVTMDPRVAAAPRALDRQLALALRVVDALRRDSTALVALRGLRSALGAERGHAGAAGLATVLDSLDRQAAALESGDAGLTRLNGRLVELYGVIEGADVDPPTQVAAAVREWLGVLATRQAEEGALERRFRSLSARFQ